MKKVLKKNAPFKQSSLKIKERQEVMKKLSLLDKEGLRNKNVLLVDDILTTGSTMKAAIQLVKEANPRRIRFLVIAATCRKL